MSGKKVPRAGGARDTSPGAGAPPVSTTSAVAPPGDQQQWTDFGSLSRSRSHAHKSSYGLGSMFADTAGDGANLQQALKERARASELRVIRRIFKHFDADNSGTIDSSELRDVMEAMGHTLTADQLAELVDQVDADGSGDINFEEFVQLINIWKEANQFKLFRSTGGTLQEQRINDAKRVALFLPDQKRIVAWHFVVLACIVYTFLVTGYLIAVNASGNDADFQFARDTVTGFDIAASVVFGLDVVVTFLTAVRVSLNGPKRMEVIDDPKEVARRYIKSAWFWVDLIAIPPALRFLPQDQIWLASCFIILKAAKVPKLFGRSGRQKMTPAYVYLHFYLIPAIRIVCYFAFFVHFLAVLVTIIFAITTVDTAAAAGLAAGAAIGSSPSSGSTSGGATVVGGNSTGAVEDGSVKQFQNANSYVNSLYFVLYTLTTAGFGDVLLDGSDARLVMAIPLCVCGTLLTGLVIGSVVSILSKTDIDKEKENKLRETLAVCQYFDVPVGVADEVLNFQNHLLADFFSDAYSDLVMGLPADMKMNINLFTRVDLISLMPFFKNAHQGAKVAIASLLTSQVFPPQQTICAFGERGDCMYFIGYGFVDVLKRNGVHVAVLKRGDFFGEGALLQANQTRNANVRAVTYCDLFLLSRPDFERVLRQFPRFRRAIIEMSKERARIAAADTTNSNFESTITFSVGPPLPTSGGAAKAVTPAAGGGGLHSSISGGDFGRSAVELMSPVSGPDRAPSFLHERLERQDELDQRMAAAHKQCDELIAACLDETRQIENLVSDLSSRTNTGRSVAGGGASATGSLNNNNNNTARSGLTWGGESIVRFDSSNANVEMQELLTGTGTSNHNHR